MKKKFCAIVLLLFIISLLSGCSAQQQPKSESDIVADITANDAFFSDYGLEVSEYTILSRRTSTERMTDEVEVEVHSECESFTYESNYVLSYSLYDDGWALDDCQKGETSWAATESVPQSEADDIARQHYGDDVTFISRDDSENASDICYSANVSEGYAIVQHAVVLQYYFSPEHGWNYEISDQPTDSVTWDILGEWYYDDAGSYLWIDIKSVDDYSMTMEYDLKCSSFGYHGKTTGNFTSNGIVTVPYEWIRKGDYQAVEPYEITLELPDTGLDPYIDNVSGMRISGLSLTRR